MKARTPTSTAGRSAPGGRTTRHRASNRGLTLLELLVVLVVIGVITTLAAPSFFSLIASSRVRAAARDVLSQMRYARDLAVRHATYARVSLDPATGGYQTTELTTDEQTRERTWQAPKDSLGVPRRLPEGVAFDRVIQPHEEAEPAVTFGPDGRGEDFFVRIKDGDERELAVHVSGTTGTAEVLSADDREAFERIEAEVAGAQKATP